MGSLVGSSSVNLRPGGAAGKRVVPSREQGLKTPAFGAGALLPPGENDFGGYVIGELFLSNYASHVRLNRLALSQIPNCAVPA